MNSSPRFNSVYKSHAKSDVSSSIRQIEKYRGLITKRIIADTIGRMRVFNMSSKIKTKQLNSSAFHLNGLRLGRLHTFVIVDDDRLYQMGGFSDSD